MSQRYKLTAPPDAIAADAVGDLLPYTLPDPDERPKPCMRKVDQDNA